MGDVFESRFSCLQRSECDGGKQHPADAGSRYGDERDRDEALAGGDVAAEVANGANRDRRAADAGEDARGKDGEGLDASHPDPLRRRRVAVAARRRYLEAETCAAEEGCDEDREDDREVEEGVLREECRPQEWYVRGAAGVDLVERAERREAVLVLGVQKVAEALPEEHEREAGDDDVRLVHDGAEHHQERQRRARSCGANDAETRASGRARGGESGERADHHHSLEPEVEDAGTLRDGFAERRQRGGNGEAEPTRKNVDGEHGTDRRERAHGRARVRRNAIRYRTRPCMMKTKSAETPTPSCIASLPFWSAAKRIAPTTVGRTLAPPSATSARAR